MGAWSLSALLSPVDWPPGGGALAGSLCVAQSRARLQPLVPGWRKRRSVVGLLVTLVANAAWSQAAGTSESLRPPVLSCVPEKRLGCGCHIRLSLPACPNRVFESQPHLFTELDATAPIVLVLDGEEVVLPHRRHKGGSMKGDPLGPSMDVYAGGGIEVTVRQRPGPSSCPKDKVDGCEFVDLATRVTLRRAGRSWDFVGASTCGC